MRWQTFLVLLAVGFLFGAVYAWVLRW